MKIIIENKEYEIPEPVHNLIHLISLERDKYKEWLLNGASYLLRAEDSCLENEKLLFTTKTCLGIFGFDKRGNFKGSFNEKE